MADGRQKRRKNSISIIHSINVQQFSRCGCNKQEIHFFLLPNAEVFSIYINFTANMSYERPVKFLTFFYLMFFGNLKSIILSFMSTATFATDRRTYRYIWIVSKFHSDQLYACTLRRIDAFYVKKIAFASDAAFAFRFEA